jgi:surface protein
MIELKTKINGCLTQNPTGACTNFEKELDYRGIPYGPISDWDVSEHLDMTSLFQDKTQFNQDLSKWDTSKVTTMEKMFLGATDFKGTYISKWDTSKVTNMNIMFLNANQFNSDLRNWNVDAVTTKNNMIRMTRGTGKFNFKTQLEAQNPTFWDSSVGWQGLGTQVYRNTIIKRTKYHCSDFGTTCPSGSTQSNWCLLCDKVECCPGDVECTCDNGTPTTGTECEAIGEDCAECDNGYVLDAPAGTGAQTCSIPPSTCAGYRDSFRKYTSIDVTVSDNAFVFTHTPPIRPPNTQTKNSFSLLDGITYDSSVTDWKNRKGSYGCELSDDGRCVQSLSYDDNPNEYGRYQFCTVEVLKNTTLVVETITTLTGYQSCSSSFGHMTIYDKTDSGEYTEASTSWPYTKIGNVMYCNLWVGPGDVYEITANKNDEPNKFDAARNVDTNDRITWQTGWTLPNPNLGGLKFCAQTAVCKSTDGSTTNSVPCRCGTNVCRGANNACTSSNDECKPLAAEPLTKLRAGITYYFRINTPGYPFQIDGATAKESGVVQYTASGTSVGYLSTDDGMSGNFEVEDARKTYYNDCLKDTSSGAPYDRNYTSTECTSGTGDCRCFLANSIETVIVDQSSESCDNGRLTYTGKTTNSVDYEISKTCLSSCQPRNARRLRAGRSLNAIIDLDNADLDGKCSETGACRGCKKCKDLQDARTDRQPFKKTVSKFVFAGVGSLTRDIGGCDPSVCLDTTKCSGTTADVCEGCKMCHTEAEILDPDAQIELTTEISTSTINTPVKLNAVFKRRGPQERTSGDGSCMPACIAAFPSEGTDICKWKKCKGCLACTLYRKNMPTARTYPVDGTSVVHKDYFRPRARTIDSDNTRNANVPSKFYGGCHVWCADAFNREDNTNIKANNPSITVEQARGKVCGWRSCSGCLACVKEAERLDAAAKNYEFRSHDGTGACLGPFLCRSGGLFKGKVQCNGCDESDPDF